LLLVGGKKENMVTLTNHHIHLQQYKSSFHSELTYQY
jgi:hypothetical protein